MIPTHLRTSIMKLWNANPGAIDFRTILFIFPRLSKPINAETHDKPSYVKNNVA